MLELKTCARHVLCFVSAVLVAAAAAAQEATTESPPRPTVTAIRLAEGEAIALDGRLDEPAWQRAVPATDFKQQIPQNGAPFAGN